MSKPSIFTFHDHELKAHYIDNKIWFESKGIARALSYSSSKSITDLYNKHSHEFKADMVTVVDSTTVTRMPYKTRIFSLRGVHLIAMFARTPVAEEFRKWVLDILDKEVSEPTPIIVKPNREILPKGVYHCKSKYNPYRASIWDTNLRKTVELGIFPSVEDALNAQREYVSTGSVKRIVNRSPSTKAFSLKNEFLHHMGHILETAQLMSTYPKGKELAWELINFVQEESARLYKGRMNDDD